MHKLGKIDQTGATMKRFCVLAIELTLLAQVAAGQSLGDLARQERERKAKQQKASVEISTDELSSGKLDTSPPLDPARKGDLDYLLERMARPNVTPEVLAAFVPLKDRAVPRLVVMLDSADSLKRVAPATVLIVLGNTDGLGSMARLLTASTQAAASAADNSAATAEARVQTSRAAAYALEATKLGCWRFTEGSALAPDQVVERLQKGPAIEIVGGVDNGQRLFNRALRSTDTNLRLAAAALVQVAAGGKDFGYRPDQPAEANESAIQQISGFLATDRAAVVSHLGAKPK